MYTTTFSPSYRGHHDFRFQSYVDHANTRRNQLDNQRQSQVKSSHTQHRLRSQIMNHGPRWHKKYHKTKTHVTPPQKLDRVSSQPSTTNKAQGIRDPNWKPIATKGSIGIKLRYPKYQTTIPEIVNYITRQKTPQTTPTNNHKQHDRAQLFFLFVFFFIFFFFIFFFFFSSSFSFLLSSSFFPSIGNAF